MKKKNYRLNDLMLSEDDMKLLNSISDDLNMRNTDLLRIILKQELVRIKNLGLKSFKLAIVGEKTR